MVPSSPECDADGAADGASDVSDALGELRSEVVARKTDAGLMPPPGVPGSPRSPVQEPRGASSCLTLIVDLAL